MLLTSEGLNLTNYFRVEFNPLKLYFYDTKPISFWILFLFLHRS
jgi:hypothetical protein